MTLYLVAAVLIVAVGAGWVLLRRRRPPDSPIRRDGATLERVEPVRSRIGTRFGGLFGGTVDDAFWRSLEEGLIASDVGVSTSEAVVNRIRTDDPGSAGEARVRLREVLIDELGVRDRSVASIGAPAVIVVVGVNGSGKTTTIAKLAAENIAAGRSVLVGSADTFRAAAAEQMMAWGDRIGFDVVRGSEGADPAAVAFDALSAARARHMDMLIVDTAGRLHSKQNLMHELAKVVRVLSRESGSVDEVLLVLDGSTGQNAIAQAGAFTEAVGVTGVAITKLDGTAKGGMALAVERELGIPLKLIGVGEGITDLLHFEPVAFVDHLLGDA